MSDNNNAETLFSRATKNFHNRLPLIYVFLSGIGFSIQSLVVKVLSERGHRASFACVFARGVIQLTLSSLCVYFDSERLAGRGPPLFGNSAFVRITLFFRSVFGFAGVAFAFLSVTYMPVGDATVLTMLSPLVSSIGSYFALGEAWRISEFAATFLTLGGATLVARPPFIFGSTGDAYAPSSYLGVVFGLLSALGAGTAYMCVRILGTTAKMPWANVCFAQAISQVALSLPLLYLSGQKLEFGLTVFEYFLVIATGLTGTVSQVAMTIGMQREKSASATAMRMSDVVFGFIWQVLFTGDAVTALSLIGAILVMSGVLTIVIFKQNDSPIHSVMDAGSKAKVEDGEDIELEMSQRTPTSEVEDDKLIDKEEEKEGDDPIKKKKVSSIRSIITARLRRVVGVGSDGKNIASSTEMEPSVLNAIYSSLSQNEAID